MPTSRPAGHEYHHSSQLPAADGEGDPYSPNSAGLRERARGIHCAYQPSQSGFSPLPGPFDHLASHEDALFPGPGQATLDSSQTTPTPGFDADLRVSRQRAILPSGSAQKTLHAFYKPGPGARAATRSARTRL